MLSQAVHYTLLISKLIFNQQCCIRANVANISHQKKQISIHYDIFHKPTFFHLSGAGSWGQQPMLRWPGKWRSGLVCIGCCSQDPAPNQLVWGNTKTFPGQPSNIISPVCPGCFPGAPPVGHAGNTSSLRRPGSILAQTTYTGCFRCGGEAALLGAPPGWQNSSPYL